jgi:hypothetical protein
VVGCSRLRPLSLTGPSFTSKELTDLRSGNGMQNYDPVNWALKVINSASGANWFSMAFSC